MNNRIPISEYRKKARVSLENQWGINIYERHPELF